MKSGSVFAVELNGLTAGSDYDQLDISGGFGTLVLEAPTLSVTLGFTPSIGDSFLIVNGPNSGEFAGLPNGASFVAGGQGFRIDYNPSASIILTAVPEPAAGLLLAAGAALLSRRRRFSMNPKP